MRRTIVVVLLLFCLAEAHALEMPPLPEARAEMYEYYRLEWLEDGYPGRKTDQGVVPHPIYGTYVVLDYLGLYRKTRDEVYLGAARHVADAALARMQPFRDALVFLYTPEMGLANVPGTFYSALTQARWLEALARLAAVSGDRKYQDAAERVLESLTIPVEEGGVAKEVAGGIAIEEWPHEIPTYTLNGWTTALLIVKEYADNTGSAKAQDLFARNMVALERLLPLYDVPELANSRYQLAGFVRMRLDFAGAEGRVLGADVTIPGEGTFPVRDDTDNRWHNHFSNGMEGDPIAFNAVLNYVSAPKPNVLDLVVEVEKPVEVNIEIGTGAYDPMMTSLKLERWDTVQSVKLEAGKNALSVPVRWDLAGLVAYPTNFKKRIGGEFYNAYHFIHVKNLDQLHRLTGNPILEHYARKWAGYPQEWPSMPVYNDAGVMLHPYKPGQ